MALTIEKVPASELVERKPDVKKDWIEESVAEMRRRNITEQLSRHMSTFDIHFTVLADQFISMQPLYFDKACIWWAWDHETTSWLMVDDYDILNMIKGYNNNQKTEDLPVLRRDHIINSLKLSARANKPLDMPKTWVQFRDVILDVKDGSMREAKRDYFCVNPIPWKLGMTSETPNIDKLFRSWVHERYVPTLYEIAAYCCLPDYPIHRAFFLAGTGRNGKSKYQKFIQRLVGAENMCSSSLTRLEKDIFATFDLYHKLVCSMGETSYDKLSSNEIFKSFTGQDLVTFQKKFKDAISGVNYAKIIVNSNGLPTPGDDSDAFWSRALPIEFPNKFEEGPCPIDAISDKEMENFCRKVTEILPSLLARAKFTGEGTVEERKKRYISMSNPLSEFLEEEYERDENSRVKYNHLFDEYKRWLSAHKRRIVQRHEFKEALVQDGYDIDKQRPSPGEDMTWVVTNLRKKTPLGKFNGVQQNETLDDGKNKHLDVEWSEWLDSQHGGSAAIDDFLAAFPLIDYEALRARGEVYEYRPGFLRRVL